MFPQTTLRKAKDRKMNQLTGKTIASVFTFPSLPARLLHDDEVKEKTHSNTVPEGVIDLEEYYYCEGMRHIYENPQSAVDVNKNTNPELFRKLIFSTKPKKEVAEPTKEVAEPTKELTFDFKSV